MSDPRLCVSDDTSFEQDLSMLLDGELETSREQEVRDHLDGCMHCSRQLVAFRGVDRALNGAALPEVPEALQMSIWDAIESNTAREDRGQTIEGEQAAPQASTPARSSPATSLPAHSSPATSLPASSSGERRSRPPRSSRISLRRWGGSVLALAASLAIYVAVADPAVDLEQVSDEELAVALELDTIRDLEVIANLELVERLVAIGVDAG